MDRVPGADHDDHRQQRREQDEPERDAVDAQMVADAEAGEPRALLDQLEAGLRRVEIAPDQRATTGRSASDVQSAIAAAVAGDDLRVAAQQHDQHHADQRQERDQGEQRPVAHVVTRAVTIEVPADQGRDADQHDEGIVVDVAGLQPDHALGRVQRAVRDTVRAEAIDDRRRRRRARGHSQWPWRAARTGSRRARRSTTCCRTDVLTGPAMAAIRGAQAGPQHVDVVGEAQAQRSSANRGASFTSSGTSCISCSTWLCSP